MRGDACLRERATAASARAPREGEGGGAALGQIRGRREKNRRKKEVVEWTRERITGEGESGEERMRERGRCVGGAEGGNVKNIGSFCHESNLCV